MEASYPVLEEEGYKIVRATSTEAGCEGRAGYKRRTGVYEKAPAHRRSEEGGHPGG